MLTRCVTRCVRSPIVWKDGRRIGSHFTSAAWMTLDFDDGTYTLEQAIRDCSDSVHVIGTTKSHRVPKPNSGACDRFRSIAPWQNPIDDPYNYQFNISKLIANYGADKACKDLARFFYPCARGRKRERRPDLPCLTAKEVRHSKVKRGKILDPRPPSKIFGAKKR